MDAADLTPTARRWALLLAEHRTSGLTLSQFAARRRVNASTLAWWRARLRHVAEAEPRFLEVQVTPAATRLGPPLRVELVAGRVFVEVHPGADLAHLRAVVEALS